MQNLMPHQIPKKEYVDENRETNEFLQFRKMKGTTIALEYTFTIDWGSTWKNKIGTWIHVHLLVAYQEKLFIQDINTGKNRLFL